MPKLKLLLIPSALLLLILSGCSKSVPGAGTVDISGVAADGYLSGAKVCLDVNDNNFCDVGEPTTKTTNGGQFILRRVDPALKKLHSVLVEVTNKTIDEDTFQKVGANYTLSAPPGKQAFISPISTEINSLMKIRQISVDDATLLLKQALGFAANENIDLFSDYIVPSKKTTSTGDRYKLLRQEAQIMASVRSRNQDNITTALSAITDPTDTNPVITKRKKLNPHTMMNPIMRILGEKIWGNLATLRNLASTKLTGIFSSTDLTALWAATAVDTSNIEADVNTNIALSAMPILSNFSSSSLNGSDQFIRIINNNLQTIFTREERNYNNSQFSFTRYDYNSGAWVANTTATPEIRYNLNLNTGLWELNSASTTKVSFSTKGITTTSAAGNSNYLGVEEKVLSGLIIDQNTHIDHVNTGLAVGNISDPKAVFSNGAKYYTWLVKTLNDQYIITGETENGACNDHKLTYTAGTLSCNQVDVLTTTTTQKALTLNDLFANSSSDIHYLDLGNNLRLQLTRIKAGDTSGVAHVVEKSWVSPSPIAFSADSEWALKTLSSGLQVLTIKLTPALLMSRQHHESSLVFAVLKGAVRHGYLLTKNTVYVNNRINFNATAVADILKQFTISPQATP